MTCGTPCCNVFGFSKGGSFDMFTLIENTTRYCQVIITIHADVLQFKIFYIYIIYIHIKLYSEQTENHHTFNHQSAISQIRPHPIPTSRSGQYQTKRLIGLLIGLLSTLPHPKYLNPKTECQRMNFTGPTQQIFTNFWPKYLKNQIFFEQTISVGCKYITLKLHTNNQENPQSR